MDDVRSKRVAFLTYCLLDQNARAEGLAKYSGPVSEIVETLTTNGVGMVQMPCPELLYSDLDRTPRPRNWYDNKEFRSLCQKCAAQVAELVDKYVKKRYQIVAIIGVEHSPSCAIERSQAKEGSDTTQGIFIQELLEKLTSRHLNNIPMIGVYIDKETIESACKRLEKTALQVKAKNSS
jgi:predicted secreted protein